MADDRFTVKELLDQWRRETATEPLEPPKWEIRLGIVCAAIQKGMFAQQILRPDTKKEINEMTEFILTGK